MSDFFLINETLEVATYEIFKNGLLELNSIEKRGDHVFNKNSLIYNLDFYASLFSNYKQEEQVIVKFLEQLTTIDEVINTEELANAYCGTDINGFLGIDYSRGVIKDQIKKVSCNDTYVIWISNYASNFAKLNAVVDNFKFSDKFEKDFQGLNEDVQESIIRTFIKAKKRGLVTPFYPDTKIVKDVSLSNRKCTVLELRVYSPVAVRVYFNEDNGHVNVVSVEQKSNPDQNADIKKAQDNLLNMYPNA
ncbi:hypothetical protein AB9K24_12250 [Meridianimaribacter flavus]